MLALRAAEGRVAFERRAAEFLDDADPPAEVREAARNHVNQLAATLPILPTTDADLAEAARLGREAVRRLREGAWYSAVVETWPAPVAHEVEQLAAALNGRQRPAPEAALLQLRDVTETLAKLPAAVLACALLRRGSEDAHWVRGQLGGVVGGKWLEFGRGAAERLLAAEPDGALAALAGLLRGTAFSRGMGELVAARNALLGHGAMRPNPAETAALVAWFVAWQDGDAAPDNDLRGSRPTSLAAALAEAVAQAPWRGLRLEAVDGEAAIDLTGAAALRQWHGDARHVEHADRTLPVRLVGAGEEPLPLRPFLAARVCRKCGRRDVFFFDTLYDTRPLRADFLDYGRGHKSRLGADAVPDLRETLQDVELPAPAEGETFAGRSTIERLDRLRVDRRYRSPRYLRDALRDAMVGADRGVFWLQAPAHLGKTTFVQGLALAELRETPLVPGLHPGRGGGVAVFFCRREYRDGRYAFLQSLAETMVEAVNLTSAKNERFPTPDDVLDVSHPDEVRPAMGRWLAEWRRLAGWGTKPMLLVVDGLDESDRGQAGDSLLDLLPRAGDLPANTWVLLTSRPVAAEGEDATPWLAAALAPVVTAGGAVTLQVGLDDPRYVALLTAYAKEVLAGEAAALADAVVRQSEHRFNLLAFLVEQYRGGAATPGELAALGTGPAIFDRFIGGLEARFGEKRADQVRLVIAVLAAAEQAHAWAFDEGRVRDRATGRDLEPMPRVFAGLDLSVLAAAADMDERPDDRGRHFGPIFVETLTLLQGALWIWRGATGQPRYRLGLRAFAERFAELRPDAVVQAHKALAGLCLDGAEGVFAALSSEQRPTDRDTGAFRDLFSLLPGHVAHAKSETIAERFRRAPLGEVASALEAQHHPTAPSRRLVLWHSAAAAALEHGAGSAHTSANSDHSLASVYVYRGNAKMSAFGFGAAAAILDYDAAIELMRTLRDALGEDWPLSWYNDLGNACMNRGNAKQSAPGFGPASAILDYDAAILLREALRDALAEDWPPPWRSELAASYMNRGVAKQDAPGFGPAASILDYDAAIRLQEALRDASGEGHWGMQHRNNLARAHSNRGRAKQDTPDFGPAAAILDYDAAILLREELRDQLGEDLPSSWRNELAGTYVNRGNAKQFAPGSGPAAAIPDYDEAISLMQALRDALGEDWPPPWRNELAAAYMNRGAAKLSAPGFGPAAAILDYEVATRLQEMLRDTLGEEHWPLPWRNELARAYVHRGIAKLSVPNLGPAAAMPDYDAAILLQEALRDALGEDWPPPWRNELAVAYLNRGVLTRRRADIAEAVGIWTEVERLLGPALPPEWARGLAEAKVRLGIIDRSPGRVPGRGVAAMVLGGLGRWIRLARRRA